MELNHQILKKNMTELFQEAVAYEGGTEEIFQDKLFDLILEFHKDWIVTDLNNIEIYLSYAPNKFEQTGPTICFLHGTNDTKQNFMIISIKDYNVYKFDKRKKEKVKIKPDFSPHDVVKKLLSDKKFLKKLREIVDEYDSSMLEHKNSKRIVQHKFYNMFDHPIVAK